MDQGTALRYKSPVMKTGSSKTLWAVVLLTFTLSHALPAYAADEVTPPKSPSQCEQPLTKPFFQFSLKTALKIQMVAALVLGAAIHWLPKTPLAEQMREEAFAKETLKNQYAFWDLKEQGTLSDDQLSRLMAPNPKLDRELSAGGFAHPERVVTRDIDPRAVQLETLFDPTLLTAEYANADWQASFTAFLAAVPQAVRDEMVQRNIRHVIIIYPDFDRERMVLRNEDPQTLVILLSGYRSDKAVLKSKGPVMMGHSPVYECFRSVDSYR